MHTKLVYAIYSEYGVEKGQDTRRWKRSVYITKGSNRTKSTFTVLLAGNAYYINHTSEKTPKFLRTFLSVRTIC